VRPGTAARSESAETAVQLPRESAIAASITSTGCMSRPIRRSSANSRPYSRAAGRSNDHRTSCRRPTR